MTGDLVLVLVLGPLTLAALTAMASARRPGAAAGRVVPVVTALATLACVPVTLRVAHEVRATGVAVVPGGWSADVGIVLRVDGLGAVLLVTTAVVGTLVVATAALVQLRAPQPAAALTGGPFFWPLWLFLLAALNAVLVAGDLFNTYVALELLTLAAVGMIALGGPGALRPALRYLLLAVLGSLLLLTAVALTVAAAGSLALPGRTDLAPAGSLGEPAVLLAVLAFATLGLAVKTALVPFHAWLPPAHAGAPAFVSPLMSALVIKASIVVLLRLWSQLPGPQATGVDVPAAVAATGTVVGVLGALAVLVGSLAALAQTRLKRVVAYSTVAQVGYFVLMVPLVLDGDPDVVGSAWRGWAILVVTHALAKTAMFLAAGALAAPTAEGAGTDDRLDALRGAAARRPAATFAFGIAGVALAGLPPSLAFAGKWQLLEAGADGPWWWALVLLLGGLLTIAYTVRVLAVLLAAGDDPVGAPAAAGAPGPWHVASRSLAGAALVAALLTVLLLPAGELLGSVVDVDVREGVAGGAR